MTGYDMIVWPDTHAPWHHRPSVALAFKIVDYVRPKIFLHGGDFADNNCCTRHRKNPNRENLLRQELRVPIALRAQLDERLKLAGVERKIITLGNHDMWLEQRIDEKMPELNGLVTFDGEMGFTANGWETVRYGNHITIGKLNVTHTWEERGQKAEAAIKTVGGNSLYFHTHHASVAYGGDALGNLHVAVNSGWLGDPDKAEYMFKMKKNRNWVHGVTLVHFTAHGDAHCQFIPFVRGVAVVDRKEIRL